MAGAVNALLMVSVMKEGNLYHDFVLIDQKRKKLLKKIDISIHQYNWLIKEMLKYKPSCGLKPVSLANKPRFGTYKEAVRGNY
mgnify:CR=1 FL=1